MLHHGVVKVMSIHQYHCTLWWHTNQTKLTPVSGAWVFGVDGCCGRFGNGGCKETTKSASSNNWRVRCKNKRAYLKEKHESSNINIINKVHKINA